MIKTRVIEAATVPELETKISETLAEENIDKSNLIDVRVMPFNTLAEVDVKGTKTKTFIQRWFSTLFYMEQDDEECTEEPDRREYAEAVSHKCMLCDYSTADNENMFFTKHLHNDYYDDKELCVIRYSGLCKSCYNSMGYHESLVKLLCLLV